MIEYLTLEKIKSLAKELEFTEEEKTDGRLWLARARTIRDREHLSDKEVLDIANNRIEKYFN